MVFITIASSRATDSHNALLVERLICKTGLADTYFEAGAYLETGEATPLKENEILRTAGLLSIDTIKVECFDP